MKTHFVFVTTLVLAMSISAWSQRSGEAQRPNEPRSGGEAQRPNEPRSGGEAQRPNEPRSGGEAQRPSEPRSGGEARRPDQPQNQPRANQGRIPAAPQQRAPRVKPEAERRAGGQTNNTPHVNNDRWYGHDKPNDKRYRLAQPFQHGRFERFGPSYRYSIVRIDQNLHRFWLPGGGFFEISAWDWPLCMDWCWSCGGDDFVIYEDPDHPGWYLLYNLYLGTFVHVMYMGM